MTLTLSPWAHVFFDALRTRHFPRERLRVGARMTLFHAIPAHHEVALRHHAATLAVDLTPPRSRTLVPAHHHPE